jgi:tetratricopeptide (TPR) repeat protein
VADVLDRAAETLEKEFAGSAVTKGALLDALGQTYHGLGLYDRAVERHTRARAVRESALGPDHPDTLYSRNNLAVAYLAAGRTAEAIALDEGTLKLREARLGPDHPDTLMSRGNLAAAYESLSRWVEAEPLRRDAVARRRKTEKPDSSLLARDLAALGRNLLKQSRWPEAEPVLRESLAIDARAQPDTWQRFNTMSVLSGGLLGQGKYADAEPLMIQGYEGMKAREAKMPALSRRLDLSEAAQRVVRLYEAWGKPKQAAAWRHKLGLDDLPADVFARP